MDVVSAAEFVKDRVLSGNFSECYFRRHLCRSNIYSSVASRLTNGVRATRTIK
jgi:hypothetical protein